MIFFIHFFIYYTRKEKTINFASVSNKNLTTINFSAKMKKNFKLLLLTLLLVSSNLCSTEVFAEEHYLVGGCTDSGWNAGEYNRSAVAMVKVSEAR